MAEHPANSCVKQIAKERHMSEMAGHHIVNVAFVEAVHAEGEVIHEGKHVVGWPHQIKSVEQSIQTCNNVANIPLRKSV